MPRGRTKKESEVLERLYGDLEIKDAESDVRLPWSAVNVKRGKRRDAAHCVVAEACREYFGSSVVAIFKTKAYVDILGENGVRHVERFIVPPLTRKLIEAFDKGEMVPQDDRQIVLKAPTPCQRLDYQLRQKRKWRKAVAKGEIKPGKGYATPRGDIHELEVRDGRGLWQVAHQENVA